MKRALMAITFIAVLSPMVTYAVSEQTQSAIDTTKQAAKEWGEVAKQKLEQGEAAAKRNWPKIKEKSKQSFDAAKQKWQDAKQ